jgi:phosphopantothenoylcysteine decarboxylase/phosphopantothenate--cysteine ligase
VEPAREKLKKEAGPPALDWRRTPDILAGLATHDQRPDLIVGFAAETENVAGEAAAKRARKGADWIVANDVSGDVMGGDANAVHLITGTDAESWDLMSKAEVARRLAQRIADALA